MARDIAVACVLLFGGIVVIALLEDGGVTAAVPAPSMPAPTQEAPASTLLADIEAAEGFRGAPYDDSLGFPTIGFGTKLPLTRTEGEILLRHRLAMNVATFRGSWPAFDDMPPGVQDALSEMAFQLGAEGLYRFADMLAALERGDWTAAADAALQSRWAEETPARAERVTGAIREGR